MTRLYNYSSPWKLVLIFILFIGIKSTGQAQVKSKAVPFTYLPNLAADQYNQRIQQKTLPDASGNFALLNKKSETAYEVGYYTSELKPLWQTTITLAPAEEIEAFNRNEQNIWVLTHQKSANGTTQSLYGHVLDVKTGKKNEPKKLLELPGKSRRIGTVASADGTKLVTYGYLYQQDQLKAITATVYDRNLTKIQDQTYSFRDLVGIQSASVRVDNAGNQYVALITNNATKLSVRRYNNTDTKVNGQDIQVGGVFEGKNIYILEAQFTIQPDSIVYAAVMCADEKTGEYHSLKVVKFDFKQNDLLYAPEFRFTPQYLAEVNKLLQTGTAPLKKLEDISLSDLIISKEHDVLVIAEKKYNENPKQPYIAKEMLLFAYDDNLKPTWYSVINKDQTAPSSVGFAGISYKKQLFGQDLQLLTLERLKGKTVLLNRTINLKTGISNTPQFLNIQLDTNEEVIYLKEFTAWLNPKTILTVLKPAKKASPFQLTRLTFK